ncbi:MAG: efflux RND transporter periplasmic adaptor subunit [Desulfobacteraceae bacterium]|nr:MAG: efflux RND transporter periplasmic adaptor subunit [Desulfobacteraceae bacterium]
MLQRTVSCFITCLLVIALSGCDGKIKPGNSKEEMSGVIKTRISEARMEKQPLLYETMGTVRAINSSTLSSKLMAAVRAINVKEGDFVKKGDILVVLDNSQVGAQLRQAEEAAAESARAHSAALSGAESARAAAKLADATYRRYQSLLKEDSASRQEFDEAEARNSQAQAALSQAEAMVQAAGHRVKQAEAALSYAKSFNRDSAIYAPYNGFITAKMAEPGDLASPGMPVLGIEGTEGGYIELVIPEAHVKNAGIGGKVGITVPASNDLLIEGRITAVAPAADAKTRSFLIKVSLPPDKNIRSGMYARVKIPLEETTVLSVPSSALVYQGQLTGIFIVDGEKKARFRLVRTGRSFDKSLEILSGLKPGEKYLLNPPSNTANGSRVEASS